jgi:GAF domain-containing protein
LEDLLKTTVKEVRRAIKSDRVLVYGLDSTDWAGIVVAESVAPGWPQTLRVRLSDPGLEDQHIESYKNGEITAINDIYRSRRKTPCIYAGDIRRGIIGIQHPYNTQQYILQSPQM